MCNVSSKTLFWDSMIMWEFQPPLKVSFSSNEFQRKKNENLTSRSDRKLKQNGLKRIGRYLCIVVSVVVFCFFFLVCLFVCLFWGGFLNIMLYGKSYDFKCWSDDFWVVGAGGTQNSLQIITTLLGLFGFLYSSTAGYIFLWGLSLSVCSWVLGWGSNPLLWLRRSWLLSGPSFTPRMEPKQAGECFQSCLPLPWAQLPSLPCMLSIFISI